VKFRFVEFEVEGGNASIQEGLRNIAAAISRSNEAALRALTGNNSVRRPASNAEEIQSPEENIAPPPVEATPQGDLFSPPESRANTRVDADRPKNPRQYTAPNVLDIDLKSGAMSLRDFAEQKQPKTDNDVYLVIAAWLKEFRQIVEVDNDHIYTCLRHLQKSPPKDVGQPLRKLKGRGFFTKGASKGFYAINHIGVDAVQRMPNG
jgi:hypothetical protein